MSYITLNVNVLEDGQVSLFISSAIKAIRHIDDSCHNPVLSRLIYSTREGNESQDYWFVSLRLMRQ